MKGLSQNMKPRTALHILIGTMLALALVFIGSSLVAGQGSGLNQMIAAQRTNPVLWLVDGCALAILGGMWFYSLMLNHFQGYLENQSNQHIDQLNEMIERTNELEVVNEEYADKIDRMDGDISRQRRDYSDQITTLEAAAEARHQVFESETRRIAESAYQAFQRQFIDTSRQLESMNLGIQFQSGELRRMRQELRAIQTVVGISHYSGIEGELYENPEDAYLLETTQTSSIETSPLPPLLEAEKGYANGALAKDSEHSEKISVKEETPADWFGEYGGKADTRNDEWKNKASERLQSGNYLDDLPETHRTTRTPMPLSNLQQYRKPQAEAENEQQI